MEIEKLLTSQLQKKEFDKFITYFLTISYERKRQHRFLSFRTWISNKN